MTRKESIENKTAQIITLTNGSIKTEKGYVAQKIYNYPDLYWYIHIIMDFATCRKEQIAIIAILLGTTIEIQPGCGYIVYIPHKVDDIIKNWKRAENMIKLEKISISASIPSKIKFKMKFVNKYKY